MVLQSFSVACILAVTQAAPQPSAKSLAPLAVVTRGKSGAVAYSPERLAMGLTIAGYDVRTWKRAFEERIPRACEFRSHTRLWVNGDDAGWECELGKVAGVEIGELYVVFLHGLSFLAASSSHGSTEVAVGGAARGTVSPAWREEGLELRWKSGSSEVVIYYYAE